MLPSRSKSCSARSCAGSDVTAFASAARSLAALSARTLGWTPETFWNATPEELVASLGALDEGLASPPSRALIAELMERDSHGR